VLFPTIQFGIFFPIVFVVSWLLRPSPRAWKLFMLAASAYFYYEGCLQARIPQELAIRYCLLLFAVAVTNQVFGLLIHRTRPPAARQLLLTAALVVNLGLLGYFKYFVLIRDTVGTVIGWAGGDSNPLPVLRPILPIAISFFIFQAISYIVDIYKDTLRPTTLLNFATYLSFFPHLVAGPIVRASEFLPQLEVQPDPRHVDSARAFRLIIAGMFKKVVISSFLLEAAVTPVFATPELHGSLDILLGIYAYAFLIYCDFSGYTDMAIGFALLLGVQFPQNFDSPYRAVTLQDFWRRWHMTLSRWLRDYLYIPLGGNRKGGWKTYRNLMLTMLLGGLWHGASWTFVVWGGIHGTWQAGERWVAERRRAQGLPEEPATPLGRTLRWFVTFHVVCLAWVFFNARTFSQAADILEQLVSFGGENTLATPLLLVTILAMLASQFVPEEWVTEVQVRFSYTPIVVQGVVLALCLWVIDALGPSGVAPFIYFQF
jgi:D-alanyl-lipoteichoic acid acyltransferase DltB (MBOAT superfamily)